MDYRAAGPQQPVTAWRVGIGNVGYDFFTDESSHRFAANASVST